MRTILLSLLLLSIAGCATFGIKDESLELQIAPLPLRRGQIATAKVNAPLSADKVIGTVEVMGSPQLEFEKDETNEIWYFKGTIPFSPWVNPGTYTVRVAYYQGSGKPRYTEMKVDLK
jgi:hypothetical protein